MMTNEAENALTKNDVRYKERTLYALLHLATFKVKNHSETKNPKEMMELMFELDKNGGIWPLRMFICFSGQWLVMLDNDKNEIENFPGSLIEEPTAFLSEDPLEVFNNILIFTVPGITLGISETHMFQVSDVSAVKLVEDLNNLRNGFPVHIERNDESLNLPTMENSVQKNNQYGINSMGVEENFKYRQQYEIDILVANHCFEDIERFVARLQFTSEAIQELQNQHVPNPHGEGFLVLRSRPPLESDFEDIIAKHKLALNYIFKIQTYFNDATEQIHNVFTSLKTVVDVCRILYSGSMIPENVVSPLLLRETINFLNGCLSEQEIEFWNSLGKNWILPQDQLKNYKRTYHPIFYDDWSPDWDVSDTADCIPVSLNNGTPLSQKRIQETWLARLETRNVRIAQAIYNRTGQNDKELEVTRGEYLEIMDSSRNWWKARNHMGKVGYVPHTILMLRNFEPPLAIYPKETDSLSSYVLETDEPNMKEKQTLAETTHSCNMTNVPAPPPMPQSKETQISTARDTLDQKEFSGDSFIDIRDRSNGDTTADALNEELRYNLIQREQRKDLEILTTPQIYISQHSSASEVEEWLRGKGFSDVIVCKLRSLNGEELFALSPHVIEGYFGQKESRRLISQIILQKNISEYKTIRSSELSSKLARARQKIEEYDKNYHS